MTASVHLVVWFLLSVIQLEALFAMCKSYYQNCDVDNANLWILSPREEFCFKHEIQIVSMSFAQTRNYEEREKYLAHNERTATEATSTIMLDSMEFDRILERNWFNTAISEAGTLVLRSFKERSWDNWLGTHWSKANLKVESRGPSLDSTCSVNLPMWAVARTIIGPCAENETWKFCEFNSTKKI